MRGTHPAAVLGMIVLIAATQSARGSITFFGVDDPRGTLTNSMQAESDFLAALSSSGTENVDTFLDNAVNPVLVFGVTGITATAGNTVVDDDILAPVSSPNYLFDGPGNEVFSFNQPVHGFGTFLISLGNGLVSNTLTFVLENTILATSQNVVVGTFGPDASLDNVAYFGVIDTANPFNRVTVQASNDIDGFGYDDLTAGFAPTSAAIPEFSSFATWAGLCAIGLLSQRRL